MLNENSLSYNEEYCVFSFTYGTRVEGMAVKQHNQECRQRESDRGEHNQSVLFHIIS